MSGTTQKTANNIRVNRNGSVVTVTALIDDITVDASFDIITLLKDIGHVPSIEEFWNTHVAALLHSSFVIQELEQLGLNNPPETIPVPVAPIDSPIQPVENPQTQPTPVTDIPAQTEFPPIVTGDPTTANMPEQTNPPTTPEVTVPQTIDNPSVDLSAAPDPGVPNVNTGQQGVTVGSVPNDGNSTNDTAADNTTTTSNGDSTNPK